MHYDTFPQFKAGLLEAASSVPADPSSPKMMSDAKIDIIFQHYNNARHQTSLTLGRLDDTKSERETLGSEFEGGGGHLLLTPKASSSFTGSAQQQMDAAMSKKWSIWLNDSFILGGIHSHAVFHLVSNISDLQGNTSNALFPFNVTQRELIGLLTFGYAGSAPLLKGSEYTCTKTQLADAATFKSYCDEMVSRESLVRQQAHP